jgi:hypothetical protein
MGSPCRAGGCQSGRVRGFTPLETQLDPVPGGGARYLVVVNTSGKELHHCRFAAYLYNGHDPDPLQHLQHFARCAGHRDFWPPGDEARFHMRGTTLEFPIVDPVTRVDVIGHCDEGTIRQSWRITESENEVRPPGVAARFSDVPGVGEVVPGS